MTAKLPYWAFALFAALLLAVYETGVVLPRAYGTDAVLRSALGLALAGVALGSFGARALDRPGAQLGPALALLSLTLSGSGYLLWATFDRGGWSMVASLGLAAFTGALAGASGTLALRAHGRAVAELGLVPWLLNPLRAGGLAAVLLALLCVFPLIGLLRTGALLGAIVAAVAAYVPAVNAELEQAPGRRAPFLVTGLAALSVCFGAGVAADAFVPFRDLARHGGDVVFVLDHPRGRHVFTRVQRSIAVFSDDLLASTSIDTPRFAEGLVHPALAAHGRPERVLLFGNGTGSVEREILRYSGVRALTSVFRDRHLSELARTSRLFEEITPALRPDARLTGLESEPAPFVGRARARGEHYSVIVADLGDPTSYLEGKHYTRHFFRDLRALLEPRGLLAIQITSPLRTPRAHATILATLEAAGFAVLPYRVPLPTLGEWGYALAADATSGASLRTRLTAAQVPRGTRLMTTQNLNDWFVQPPIPVEAPAASPPINHLYDQPLVGLYHDEEQAHWN